MRLDPSTESTELNELAMRAKEQAEISPEQLFDIICVGMAEERKALQSLYEHTVEMLVNWPQFKEQAYSAYAEAIGVTVAELEDVQKQQAILNHILGEEEE
jgi:hypothetical protein